MFGVNPLHVGLDHSLVSPLSSEARVYALPYNLRERAEGIDSLMHIISPYVSPGKILLANSLRLLPLTAWRGLGQESSGGALQRPSPFGFATSNPCAASHQSP